MTLDATGSDPRRLKRHPRAIGAVTLLFLFALAATLTVVQTRPSDGGAPAAAGPPAPLEQATASRAKAVRAVHAHRRCLTAPPALRAASYGPFGTAV